MSGLRAGLEPAIKELLARSLFNCVGLKALFEGEEMGEHGSWIVPGRVRALQVSFGGPHTGWDQVEAGRCVVYQVNLAYVYFNLVTVSRGIHLM
jgi:imidazoleglycerol phosphate synthase glutamine amidotransferase subunit HisH